MLGRELTEIEKQFIATQHAIERRRMDVACSVTGFQSFGIFIPVVMAPAMLIRPAILANAMHNIQSFPHNPVLQIIVAAIALGGAALGIEALRVRKLEQDFISGIPMKNAAKELGRMADSDIDLRQYYRAYERPLRRAIRFYNAPEAAKSPAIA